MGILKTYIEEQAENKKLSVTEWMQKRIDEIPFCKIATHVGKFSHPDAKVTLYDTSDSPCKGYVATSNSAHDVDVSVNAAYMGTAKLLFDKLLDDGHNVFFHVVTGSSLVEEEFKALHLDEALYHIFKERILQCSRPSPPDTTDGLLKQVYFPVGADSYHLLTVMPSSSVLLKLKGKVKQLDEHRKQCREAGADYDELWDLTAISFGGTKPQNISYLNNANGGTAYLLSSLPPVLSGRQVRKPKRNFFRESLSFRNYKYIFKELHVLFKEDRNNKKIRDAVRARIEQLISQAMMTAYAFRREGEGWSDDGAYASLPLHQKIWLDPHYALQRKEEEWREELSADFGRWVIRTYEYILKKESCTLGDGEMHFFKHKFRDELDKAVRCE